MKVTARILSFVTVSGFHPVWDEQLEFDVQCPDLAIINFRVMDHEDRRSNKMVAQYSLPFRCMQNGEWRRRGRGR